MTQAAAAPPPRTAVDTAAGASRVEEVEATGEVEEGAEDMEG